MHETETTDGWDQTRGPRQMVGTRQDQGLQTDRGSRPRPGAERPVPIGWGMSEEKQDSARSALSR